MRAALDPEAIAAPASGSLSRCDRRLRGEPADTGNGLDRRNLPPHRRHRSTSDMAFLEHLPLRGLTAHVAERVSRRILSR